MNMKKCLLVSGLALASGFAAAEEVGKVLSSTPVTREVGVQQRQCAPDASPREPCRSVTNFETRTVGYKVVYEYAGKRYTTQLPEDPGATVSLQITPAVQSRPASRPSAVHEATNTEPAYEQRWDVDRDRPYQIRRSNEGWDADRDRGYTETIPLEPRYVERVYVAPGYYAPRPYAYPSSYGYYGAPYWPLLGLSIGLSHGLRGYGGHFGHGSSSCGSRLCASGPTTFRCSRSISSPPWRSAAGNRSSGSRSTVSRRSPVTRGPATFASCATCSIARSPSRPAHSGSPI